MAHVRIDNGFPGITGLMFHKRATGKAIAALTQAALRGPSSMTPAERELVGAHVSWLNGCAYCRDAHASTATELLQDGGAAAACALTARPAQDALTPRMRALLQLAARVAEGGRAVSAADVARAKEAGATEDDVHDTVLVASLFCFFNRYVDGLAMETPTDQGYYREGGEFLARRGYPAPGAVARFFLARMMRKHRRVEAGNPD